VITVERGAIDEDRLMELALEAGADDVVSEDDSFQVMTAPEAFSAVREALEAAKVPAAGAEVVRVPENTVKVSGHTAEQMLKLMEELEDHEEVQSVAANFDISDEELAQFSAA
jgi:transcriptional/translational regulatory protein YebC/TACO1